MADHIYDLIIIGAGPAGYTAALRAAAMGMDAVLIEKKALGGSCVNTGCIPAKALLQATAVYRDMLKAFRFGIVAEKVSFDWRQMQIYKNESVESFRSMIQGMLEKAEVEMIHGDARLHADNVVRVTTSKGALTLKGKNVILATGSSPVIPDIPGIDLPQVMTSRDILRMDDWNFDCLTVIGGGVIGVEIATIFAALGSRVTLLEQANRLLESMDPMISEQMEANLRSKGIEVHCNVQVMEIKDRGNDTVSVNYRCERGWKESPGGPRAGGSRQTPEYVEGSGGRLSGTAGKWASAHQGNLPHDAGKCLCDRRYRGAETSCPCGSVPCGLSGRKPGGTRTPDAAFGRAERYVCRASGCADLYLYGAGDCGGWIYGK